MDIVKAMNEMSLWTDSPVQHIQDLDPQLQARAQDRY